MTNDEVDYFRRAEALANSGQTRVAHRMFCALRDHGNTEVEIFFWIATTSTNPYDAKRAIDVIKRLQPYHPRLPQLIAFHKKKRSYAIRICCAFYLVAIACIFPIATMSLPKVIAIIYIVLFNLVLVVNIVRLVMKHRVFTTWSALYSAALIGFFMAIATGQPTGVPEMVFGASILFIAVYTIVLAVRGIVTGRV